MAIFLSILQNDTYSVLSLITAFSSTIILSSNQSCSRKFWHLTLRSSGLSPHAFTWTLTRLLLKTSGRLWRETNTRTQRNRFIQLYVLTRDTKTVTASQKSNKHADLLNRFNKETDTQSQQFIIQLLLPLDTVITLQHDYKANYWTNSWVMIFQFNLGFGELHISSVVG